MTQRYAFVPGAGLVRDTAPAPAVLPIGLGTDLSARWLLSSDPDGAAIAFDGVPGIVSTEIGIRNLRAQAVRTMIMRKTGYRDCRAADARRDVVARDGLEWNSIHCALRPAGE